MPTDRLATLAFVYFAHSKLPYDALPVWYCYNNPNNLTVN